MTRIRFKNILFPKVITLLFFVSESIAESEIYTGFFNPDEVGDA
jgi:hypothetical protein